MVIVVLVMVMVMVIVMVMVMVHVLKALYPVGPHSISLTKHHQTQCSDWPKLPSTCRSMSEIIALAMSLRPKPNSPD